jgi:hypothetical protein
VWEGSSSARENQRERCERDPRERAEGKRGLGEINVRGLRAMSVRGLGAINVRGLWAMGTSATRQSTSSVVLGAGGYNCVQQ